MKKKVAKKKVAKKKVAKKKIATSRKTSHELVVRVESVPATALIPTESEIVEPMRAGKSLAITKTWVSEKQIMQMVGRTPKEHLYTRPGKGGQTWTYVTGNYVEKVLNFVFGFLWDFDVVTHGREGDQVWVQGKLTVKDARGNSISKTQFGRADIKFKKNTKEMLDFGNDLKAATTDALKKCASLLGIASDIYGKSEYKQETGVDVRDDSKNQAWVAPKSQTAPIESTLKPGQIVGPEGTYVYVCSTGEEVITEQEANFSLKLFGKRLCREHQKGAKRK